MSNPSAFVAILLGASFSFPILWRCGFLIDVRLYVSLLGFAVLLSIVVSTWIRRKNVVKHSRILMAFTSTLLCVVFISSLRVLLWYGDPEISRSIRLFAGYAAVLSFFHWSECAMTALVHDQHADNAPTWNSFLLNHSPAYTAAAVASWIEFSIEMVVVSGFKCWSIISFVGLLLCIFGECLRKSAMWHAGRNFTHLISYQRRQTHELVTSGIYGYCRHPSYVGWFWWSIGTQVLLLNPFCTVAYAAASWRFFNERIYEEEFTLIHFFNDDYVRYQKRVGTGLPGIKGYCRR